uniref:Uncharacterized protein n=1 Tax=Chenopodium quinoa TaxID=63459 RepID=A0A803N1N4_CHEQI
MAVAWGAWAYRNPMVFDNPWSSSVVGVMGFVKLVEDYGKYKGAVGEVSRGCGVVSHSTWKKPCPGVVRFV